MNGTGYKEESALGSRDEKLSYTALEYVCPLGYLAIPLLRLHKLLSAFGRTILLNNKKNLRLGSQNGGLRLEKSHFPLRIRMNWVGPTLTAHHLELQIHK